jgi:penicillin amidase
VYADAKSVGWLLAAEVPIRKSGYGSLPLPGWSPEVGWETDVITSSELPWLENPAAGYISCANNQPAEAAVDVPFLGHDFLDGYRQTRISEELAARTDWTIDATSALQTDLTSLVFREVRSVLLALVPKDSSSRRGLQLLTEWDGVVSGNSPAASVFELFLGELCQRACRVKAPNSWGVAAGVGVMKLIPGTCWNARRASFTARLIVQQPAGFFESWPGEMVSCLSHVIDWLARDFGTDEHAWAWGRVRPLPLNHHLGQQKILASIYNRGPLPGYGDGTTVNQAGFEFWKPLRHSTVTAHQRAVIDVGNWGASRYVLLGGQSGNPLSDHYADLVPIWQQGRGVPIHWEDEAVAKHTISTLTLIPDSNASRQERVGSPP